MNEIIKQKLTELWQEADAQHDLPIYFIANVLLAQYLTGDRQKLSDLAKWVSRFEGGTLLHASIPEGQQVVLGSAGDFSPEPTWEM